MKIVIGSENRAKKAAVESVFRLVFSNENIQISTHSVESGVSTMPTNNEETLQGAINRAKAVQLLEPNADYFVGLESGVYEGPFGGMYILGWVALIKNDDETIGMGHSGGVMLPKDIAAALRGGSDLGPLISKKIGDNSGEIRHTLGTTGLLTKGLYPRNREFEDALKNAFAPFVSEEFYVN